MSIRMRAPTGEVADVEEGDLQHYLDLGAQVISSDSLPSPLSPPAAMDASAAKMAGDARGIGGTPPDPIAMLLGSLPMAGAIGGGALGMAGGSILGTPVAGVPAAVGMAALGGSGLEAIRQLIARSIGRNDLAPNSPMDALGNIGVQGAIGAGGEGAGMALSAASRGLGRAMLSDALGASPTLARGQVVRGGPSPVDIMQRERIPVGKAPVRLPGTPKGTGFERIQARVGESVGNLESKLSASPGKFTVRDVVFEASNDLARLRKRAANAKQFDAIDEAIREATDFGKQGNKPARLSLSELNERKRTWQSMAKGQFAAEARTASKQQASAGVAGFDQEVAKALAAAANRLIERSVPGARAINQQSQELGLLRNAIASAESRKVTINPFAHGGLANPHFALADPAVTSRAGLALTNPNLLKLINQLPLAGVLGYESSNAFNAGNR